MTPRILILLLLACKPYSSKESAKLKTVGPTPAAYEGLLNTHTWVETTSFGVFPELSGFVYYSQELEAALQDKHKFTAAQRIHLEKILHKMRSIIAFALRAGCFVWPENHQRGDPFFLQKVFDLDQMTMVTVEKDKHDMKIYKNLPCAIILNKMRELTPAQLDHTQSNAKYFQDIMQLSDIGVQKLYRVDTSNTYAGHMRYFFKQALLPQIMANTKKTMGDTLKRFPFHRASFYDLCEQRKKEKFTGKAILPLSIARAQKLRDTIDCHTLNHPPTTITSEQVFPDIATLVGHINYIVTELNKHRAELHALVRQHTRLITKADGTQVLEINYGTVKPKYFLLPFVKIFQETDLEDTRVLKAYDGYHETIFTATKTGALPLLLALNRKKFGTNPGLHLEHLGSNFGFTSPSYYPLPLLKYGKEGERRVQQTLAEIKMELIDSWLEAQEKQLLANSSEEQDIYTYMLAHEIATAQVLLQDPTQAAAVSSLLRKFQHDPITPKWLRAAKVSVEVLDIGLIALLILPFVPYTIPLALASTAVNFLWMGTAAASARFAHRRLRLAERALLSGNSQQVRCGMELLQKFYEKRRDADVASGVGGAFTLTGLSMIARGLDGKFKTAGVEIVAAFSSEIEIVSGGRVDDEQTDAQRLKDCFE